MAHYVFLGDGGVGVQSANTFAIPAAGDDLVILNEAGSSVDIDLQFPAALSGDVYRLNDKPTVGDNPGSLLESVSGNFTLKVGAESGARIHVDNSSNAAVNVTVPAGTATYSPLRITHRTSASRGASVWLAIG